MYNYQEEKPKIFLESYQKTFLDIRDNVRRLFKIKQTISMEDAIDGQTGDVWFMLACVDRLVELNEIKEINKNRNGFAQHRMFVNNCLL